MKTVEELRNRAKETKRILSMIKDNSFYVTELEKAMTQSLAESAELMERTADEMEEMLALLKKESI